MSRKILVNFSDEVAKEFNEKVRPYKRSAYINAVLSHHFRAIDDALATLRKADISLDLIKGSHSIKPPCNEVAFAIYLISKELSQSNGIIEEILENEVTG